MILKVQDMLKLPKFFHKNIEKNEASEAFLSKSSRVFGDFPTQLLFSTFWMYCPKEVVKN